MEIADLLAEIGGADDRTAHELYLSAVHEAGHAVAAVEIGIGVRGVTIRATDTTGGGFSRGRASYFMTEHDIHDELVCLLAGRAAEQVVLGEASCGAGGGADSDLAVATWLAARGVSECGFDGQRGLLWQPISERRSDLGDALSRDAVLAAMVRQRLADAYSDACALLLRRRTAVQSVATALLERTALDGGEVARIVEEDGRGSLL
jgi:ATP-dependent Zn protease